MEEKELLERLDRIHEKNGHKAILYEIAHIPPERQGSYQIQSRLARAYGNLGEYSRAMSILESLREQGEGDMLWWHRMACGYFGLERYAQCMECLRRVLEMGGDEEIMEQSRRMLRDIEMLESVSRNGTAKSNKKGKGAKW